MKVLTFATAMLLVTLIACKQAPLATLPDFSFMLSDSVTILNSKDIPGDDPIVLIHFESDCRECHQMTDSLLNEMWQFSKVHFYFLSTEHISHITLFKDYFKLMKYPNVIVGQDYMRFMSGHFKSHGTPLIALYDRYRHLSGIYFGKPINSQLIASIKALQ